MLHIGGNYKNVPFTTAKRHQLDVASTLLYGESQKHVRCGIGHAMLITQLSADVQTVLGVKNDDETWYYCDKVEFSGTIYKVGCYLATKVAGNDAPVFVLITEIYVHCKSNNVKFYCEKLSTISFNDHWHGWGIDFIVTKNYVCIDSASLDYFIPLS